MSVRNETFDIGFYCLAFIDILNQKEALRKIHTLPDTEAEKAEFISQWRETFGVVDAYRSSFDTFFKSHLQPPQVNLPYLDDEKIKLMNVCLNYEIREQLFSDTMIYYVSMMEHPDRLAITGIYTLLLACAGAFLVTLSDGLVCRGGIEAGLAGGSSKVRYMARLYIMLTTWKVRLPSILESRSGRNSANTSKPK
jgi:hypothetical protein